VSDATDEDISALRNWTPPTDETGDVDLSLVDYWLSLTPEQRLKQLEEFANFIVSARRANGVEEWSNSEQF
jgi:hypothetical protein